MISKGEVGGAQSSLLNYVNALKCKYDQFVFIGGKSKFLSSRLCEIKVESAQFQILSIFRLLSFAYLLRTRVKCDSPVIITHSFIASAVTRIVLLGTGAKITYVVHGFVGNPAVSILKRSIGMMVERSLRGGVIKYIAITNYERKLINKKLKTKSILIPNTSKKTLTGKSTSKNTHRLICLSRFARPKLNQLIVKSFLNSKLINHPNYELCFYGNGPDLGKCKQLVSKSINNIQFNPPVSDVSELMIKASSLILMSDHEGLPMTIVEALSYDLPVVCSEIPELTETFRNESSLNIKFCKNNQESLTEFLNMYEGWIRGVEAGLNKRYFNENFNYKKIHDQINAII